MTTADHADPAANPESARPNCHPTRQVHLDTLLKIAAGGIGCILIFSLLPWITAGDFGHYELHAGKFACYPDGGQGVGAHNTFVALCVVYFFLVAIFMCVAYALSYRKISIVMARTRCVGTLPPHHSPPLPAESRRGV